MSHLALTLTTAPKIDIDASSITAALQTCQAVELMRTELLDTRGKPAGNVGDYFSVTPTAAPEHRIEGELSEFHRLAAGWTHAMLTVVGNVGSFFASGMRSGSITLRGTAGDHCASQLRGGRLNVEGDVGNYVGGPNPGIRSGMSGGEVVIQGKAGIHAGYRMRRGMLIVLGDCDEGVGSEMVAGTLIVTGRCGSLVWHRHASRHDCLRRRTTRTVWLTFHRTARATADVCSLACRTLTSHCTGDFKPVVGWSRSAFPGRSHSGRARRVVAAVVGFASSHILYLSRYAQRAGQRLT